MHNLKTWLRLVEGRNVPVGFIDHLHDAVEAAQVGFHFEEGGCWGMALALYDAFQTLGEHPQLMLQTDGFAHALVMVRNQLYDYSGAVDHNPPVIPTTRTGLLRAALKSGRSADDVRGDAIAATEIIQAAQTWGDA